MYFNNKRVLTFATRYARRKRKKKRKIMKKKNAELSSPTNLHGLQQPPPATATSSHNHPPQ